MDSLDSFRGTYNEQLVKKAQKYKVPISGTFELLPLCNMKCKMCYIQQNPVDVNAHGGLQPIEFWVDIFKQSIEEGMLFPLLTGGEPFLYPGFFELYERIINLGIHLCINTNATLLNREKIALLAKNPPRRLNISLYGGSEETYQKLCQNGAGFQKVIEAFELLNEYNIPFRVHSTLVPDNIQDYEKIIEICNKYKAPLAMVEYMFPAYRKDGIVATNEGRFSPVEMAEVAVRHRKDMHHGDSPEYKQYVSSACSIIENPSIYPLYNNDLVVCNGGSCTFWVDWQGRLSGCGVHNQAAVDLHQTSFAEAWGQVLETTKNMRISEKCKTCKYRCICPICTASAFCETGKVNGTPQYLCEFCEEYSRLLYLEKERLFKYE